MGIRVHNRRKGQTSFVLHASKLVQFKSNGHAICTMSDHPLWCYGIKSGEDHIYGSDLTTTRRKGIVRPGRGADSPQASLSESNQPTGDAGNAEKGNIISKPESCL